MQAVILAAGMGKRLKELTRNNTKCMVEVNGITLAERALRILDKKSLSKIAIVDGYQRENLEKYIDSLGISTPIVYVRNDIYDTTNNIYSLLLAKDYLVAEDTLLLESDLIFEEALIDALLDDERKTLALVDHYESWMDGTCTVIDDEDRIVDFVPGKYLRFEEKEKYFKTVNIYKFDKVFSSNVYIPFLEAYLKAMGVNEYYESVIKLIAMLEGTGIRVKRLKGEVWYEIDDEQDLDIACTLFPDDNKKAYEAIASRYGGYWRYPKLMDYCYLVNPYFPPEKMVNEIKSNFKELLVQYPSGMRVNSLLAAKNFGVHKEHIVIGNGAAELIKSMMENVVRGRIGVVRPTFEEYPNRYQGEMVVFKSSNEDFSYTANDIMGYFGENKIDWLIIINPDNPSGNYIPYSDLRVLIDWCKERNIGFILDESFVDFANENGQRDVTLINETDLGSYNRLYVVKSISKSYGVPGLRLGVMASSDCEVIGNIKKDVAIWNINSFGEFYMQIYEKYKKDYAKALAGFRESRAEMIEGLKRIDEITVYPSEANFIMCKVANSIDVKELCAQLYSKNILIKDLTSKVENGEQYIRLAVKRKEENTILIENIKEIMGQ